MGDGWFGVGEEVNLTPDIGGFEADLWAIEPALPEGLTFGSMARTSSGAITGVPLAASDATTYTVWANSSVDNTSINTSFVLGVFADHDEDGQPDVTSSPRLARFRPTSTTTTTAMRTPWRPRAAATRTTGPLCLKTASSSTA